MKAITFFSVLMGLLLLLACQNNDPISSIAPSPSNGTHALANSSPSVGRSSSIVYVYGPEVFLRNKETPQTELRQFNVDNPQAIHTMVVSNGDENQENRVSSALISLNGQLVIGPNQFNQQVDNINVPVIVGANNLLEVKLAGKPEGRITVSILKQEFMRLLFKDDFENITVGDYPDENGWTNVYSGVNSYVTDEIFCSGSKSFKLIGQPYWSRTEKVDIPNVPKIKYEAKVYIPAPANSYPHVGLFNPSLSTWGYMFPTIRFDRLIWKVFAYGVPNVERLEIADWSPDQWYHVEVIADFSLKKMDIYLNGVLVREEEPLNNYSNYTSFHFATGGYNEPGNSVLFVDDVIIYGYE
jgi:hypothetical protein